MKKTLLLSILKQIVGEMSAHNINLSLIFYNIPQKL